MATATNFYVDVKLDDNDIRLVRLESSRDYENVVEFVMRHKPNKFTLRSKVFFTYDLEDGQKCTVSTPLELHHALHQDKSFQEHRLELRPELK